MALVGSSLLVSATKMPNTVTVTGKIETSIHFEKSEISNTKEWLNQTKNEDLAQINNEIAQEKDPIQKNLLEQTKKALENYNPTENLKVNKDGSANLAGTAPHAQVTIAGKTVTASLDGKYTVDAVPIGTHHVTVSSNDVPIAEQKVKISPKNLVIINPKVTATSQDIKTAATDMSQETGTVQSVRYYKYAHDVQGGIQPMHWAKGGNQVVSCNEAAKDSSKSSTFYNKNTDLSKFPHNNSDCARNIAQGSMVATSGSSSLYQRYGNSVNCLNESFAAMLRRVGDGWAKNQYCNGKKKSGGHYNCSWFYGVREPERLHTGW